MTMRQIAATFAVASITTGIANAGVMMTPQASSDTTGFQVKLNLEHQKIKAAAHGPISHVHTVLTLSNTTDHDLTYTQGGLTVDWQILDTSGVLLYDSNRGKLIPHYRMMRVLRSGDHADYRGDIPLQSQGGAALPAGRYVLRAKFQGQPNFDAQQAFVVSR